MHVYSLDEDLIFDPISLTEAITPAAVEAKLSQADYGTALRMAIHLNEYSIVRHVLEATPYASIPHVLRVVGPEQLERLMQFLSKVMNDSPHLDFYLEWCLSLLQIHGQHIDKHRGSFMRALRALHKIVQVRHDDLGRVCDENKYLLAFLEDQAMLTVSR